MNPKSIPMDVGTGGVLSGLRSKRADLPNGGHGYIMSLKQAQVARQGGTPDGFVRDEKGHLRPLVQGGN